MLKWGDPEQVVAETQTVKPERHQWQQYVSQQQSLRHSTGGQGKISFFSTKLLRIRWGPSFRVREEASGFYLRKAFPFRGTKTSIALT